MALLAFAVAPNDLFFFRVLALAIGKPKAKNSPAGTTNPKIVGALDVARLLNGQTFPPRVD
jgi:hypothetical protein